MSVENLSTDEQIFIQNNPFEKACNRRLTVKYNANVNVNQKFLVWLKRQNYYEVHRGVEESHYKIRK